jgi:putative pre-16S rRNA nuclease
VRILGVDFGLRHLGLALSDPGESIATPLRSLSISSVREAPAAVARAALETGAKAVVVGMPEGLEGQESRPEVLRARRFARALRRALSMPVHLVDESLSTREARDRLTAGRGAVSEADLHAAAAAVILQRWLDERARARRGGPTA